MPKDLAAFLNARWDEEERDCELFHELDCPAAQESGQASPPACRCPCQAQMLGRIASHRRILEDCEQHIKRERDAGLRWPLESVVAFQQMKALALPFELHPAWRDTWYP